MTDTGKNSHQHESESATPGHRNWLVWFDEHWKRCSPVTRGIVARYLRPTKIERYRDGLIYRIVGIQLIAYIIPTGGLLWRRLFKWNGWSFALGGASIRRAREYRYNTCVFELLHSVGLLLMLPDGIRSIQHGYSDGIVHFLVAGVLVNGYPWMLQRYNRARIYNLLDRYESRRLSRHKRSNQSEGETAQNE